MAVATQPFAGDPSANQLSMAANDALVVLERASPDWWWVRHAATNAEGFVPAAYVQAQGQQGQAGGSRAVDSTSRLRQASRPPLPEHQKFDPRSVTQTYDQYYRGV